MLESSESAEILLNQAIAVLETREDSLLVALDELPAPIYATDSDGVIIHFNSACIDFAGRTPVPGKDRWCVTWKLFTTDGAFMPHEDCPMAEAIRHRRPVRGVAAIAERPDGTRVRFMPYPTPIFDEDGNLRCAVNMLIDLSDRMQSDSLRVQAEKCRWHARSIGDEKAAAALTKLAEEYDVKADELDRQHGVWFECGRVAAALLQKSFAPHLRRRSTISISDEFTDSAVRCRVMSRSNSLPG